MYIRRWSGDNGSPMSATHSVQFVMTKRKMISLGVTRSSCRRTARSEVSADDTKKLKPLSLPERCNCKGRARRESERERKNLDDAQWLINMCILER